MANRRNGALHTGVCADIAARMMQHRAGKGSAFCAEYGIDKLVFVETHEEIGTAITCEKQIKRWRHAWKIALIEENNPDWCDLSFDLNR